MIAVGIADRHPVIRAGLRRLLSEFVDLRVAGEATNEHEAVMLVEATELDVLVMDLPRAGQAGFDAMSVIGARVPDVGMLIFTALPAEHFAVDALRQGARGYLGKHCDPREVVHAIRAISLGDHYFSREVSDLLARRFDRRSDGAAHELLSTRETEVFYKLAKGESAAGIAAALAVSVKTVSTYRTRLLDKLCLSSNTDLTYYAFHNRLIC